MNRTFINSFKVTFAEDANAFIYYLKRIPFIGRKIPDKLYEKTQAKIVIGTIRKFLGIFGSLAGKAIYFGLIIILPCYLMKHSMHDILPEFLHIFFLMSFILGSLLGTVVLNGFSKQAFDIIILMKCDAREYYTGEITCRRLLDFIYFFISLAVIGLIIGFSPFKALILTIELISFKFMGEWLYLYVYSKTGKIISDINWIIILLITVGCIASYLLPALRHPIAFGDILFNNFFAVFTASLGAAAFVYILNYKKYEIAAKQILKSNNIFNKQAFTSDMNFGDVKINEKKMSKEDLNTKKYDKKHGYEYLNSLFFMRHRRILIRPVEITIGIIAVCFIVVMCLILFDPSEKAKIINSVFSTPIYVFVMYLMSTGDRICKAMFYNCDSSLLRYTFYRQSRVVLFNFSLRLRMAIFLNIIPALVLCLALTGVIIAGGSYEQLLSVIPIFLSIICLSCFFCIYHLFMYYIVQPYTAQLTQKSPLFTIANTAMYFICYACLKIKTTSYYFTLGVIAVTVIFMIVSLFTIYKMAPKTFKLR